MKSKEGNKLINQIKKSLENKGVIDEEIITDLQTLRTYAVEENEPALAKLIRLIYEHIDQYGDFLISIPQDDIVDENGELMEDVEEEDDFNSVESLDYVLSLILESDNKFNREEMNEYRDLLKSYAE
jgi:hypothetical protein